MSSFARCYAIAWTLPHSSSSPALSWLAAPSSPGRCGCGRGRGAVRPAPGTAAAPSRGVGRLAGPGRRAARPRSLPCCSAGCPLAACRALAACCRLRGPVSWLAARRASQDRRAGVRPGRARRGLGGPARRSREASESLNFIRFGPLDPGLGFLSFSDLRRIITLPLTTWALALILAVSDGARRNQTVFRPTGKHPWRMDILGSVEAPSLPVLFILPAVRDAHAAAPRGPPWGSVRVW